MIVWTWVHWPWTAGSAAAAAATISTKKCGWTNVLQCRKELNGVWVCAWGEHWSEQWLAAWRCVRDETVCVSFFLFRRARLFLRGKEILSKWSAIEIKSRHDLKRSVCNMFLANGHSSHLINGRECWSKWRARAFTIAHDDRDCSFGRYENASSQSNTHSCTPFRCPTRCNTNHQNKQDRGICNA